MRQYLSSVVVVLLGVACGGSTGTEDAGGAGTSAGGAASAGSNHGGSSAAGSSSTAGKASGGSSSAGSGNNAGSVSVAGAGGTSTAAGSGGVGSGGTGVLNPDCPARAPAGACSADDAGVRCQYDPSTNCLCYPSAPGTFTPCQKVDPTCMYAAPAAPAPLPDGGAGGVSGKIALPPHQYCSCSGTAWSCTYGI